MDSGFLDTPAAARYLQAIGLDVSERTLQGWRWRGLGPAYLKVGGKVFYAPGDLEAFLRRSRVAPPGRPEISA